MMGMEGWWLYMAHEAMIGAYSAYAIAVKHGYKGTEAEWIAAQEAASGAAEAAASNAEQLRDEAKQTLEREGEHQRGLIETKGAETLAAIPGNYTDMHNQIQQNAADLLRVSPGVECEASGSEVSVADAAARPVLQVASAITAVQGGSGDPSSDNVRPISGWDAVTLTRSGANLMPFPYYTMTSQEANGGKITINADRSLTFSGTPTGYVGVQVYMGPVLGKGTITVGLLGNVVQVSTSVTLFDAAGTQLFVNDRVTPTTVDLNKYPTAARLSVLVKRATPNVGMSGTAWPVIVQGDKMPAEYTPYVEPVTLTANLPETVYGGSLNRTAGVLTVTHIIKTIRSSDVYYRYDNTQPEWQTTAFAISADNRLAVGAMTSTCSHFTNTNGKAFDPAAARKGMFSDHPTNTMKYFAWGERGGTEDEFKAWLEAQYTAGTPVQIVCKLAEPYTIQLTPQQLDMLKGYNALWSDTGDTSVAYVADTKMYIDNRLAELTAAVLSTGANV